MDFFKFIDIVFIIIGCLLGAFLLLFAIAMLAAYLMAKEIKKFREEEHKKRWEEFEKENFEDLNYTLNMLNIPVQDDRKPDEPIY